MPYNEYEIGETEGYRKGYEAGRANTELEGKLLWFGIGALSTVIIFLLDLFL